MTSKLRQKMFAVLAALSCSVLLTGFDVDSTSRSVYRILTQESLGSGFLVGGQRFVVTNNHVVESKRPTGVFIAFMLQGRPVVVRARIVKRSAEKDLALLEAESDLPGQPLSLGVYEPEKATDAFAIGFPGAADNASITTDRQGQIQFPAHFLDATVTRGTVSRFLRDPALFGGAAAVQHTSPIAPGNSGGPLFDTCNNVTAVNTLLSNRAQNLYLGPHASEVASYIRPEVASARTTSIKCLSGVANAAERLQDVYLLAAGTGVLALGALLVAFRRRPAVKAPLTFVRERVASALLKQAKPAPLPRSPIVSKSMRLVPLSGGAPMIDINAERLTNGKALRVGRGVDVDVTISHDTVSKLHARIYADGGNRFWLEDAGSSNGVFINGQRSSKAELLPRQAIKFGDVEYIVEG